MCPAPAPPGPERAQSSPPTTPTTPGSERANGAAQAQWAAQPTRAPDTDLVATLALWDLTASCLTVRYYDYVTPCALCCPEPLLLSHLVPGN